MQTKQMLDGTSIPVLGLGTWQIGGGTSPDTSRDAEMIDLLRTAIHMGYTHLDTAEYYGDGHTEELLGAAIADLDRSDLFITSKVWNNHLRYDAVLRALDRTLQRLGSDYVDLYLIHWPNPDVPLEETMRALNTAAADGRIRRLGVSNFDRDLMRRAVALAQAPLVTNQVRYSLLDREPADNGVLAECQSSGLLLTAYSPIKGGVLGHPVVKRIAAAHAVSPAQVALQWLVQQPNVITIPKSADEAHLRDNLAALDLSLDADEIQQLNTIQDK